MVETRPVIVAPPVNQEVYPGKTVRWEVKAEGSVPLFCQWYFRGAAMAGATNTTLVVDSVTSRHAGLYTVAVSNAMGVTTAEARLTLQEVVVLGYDTEGQTNVKPGLSNVVAIGGGGVALRGDGTVVAWVGDSYDREQVISQITNAVAVACGMNHGLALKADGRVVAWGYDGFDTTRVPRGLSNVIAIAAGGYHSLALKRDGTVVAWGFNVSGQTNVPNGLSNVVAIAGGGMHSLALKGDGTVVAWGANYSHQTRVPAGLSNVVAIAAGASHSLALKADGTAVGWGSNSDEYGRYGGKADVPVELSNIVAIAAEASHSLALLGNGQIVTWGIGVNGKRVIPTGLTNVAAISASGYSSLALAGEFAPFFSVPPRDQRAYTGATVILRSVATGTRPLSYQWQRNGVAIADATNSILVLPQVQFEHSGSYSVVASNSYGTRSSASAVLTVMDGPPVVVHAPARMISYPGGETAFQVVTEGSAPLHYQWQFSNTNIAGATNFVLILDPVTRNQEGIYSVVISNAFGAVTNSNAALVVTPVAAWGDSFYGQTNVPPTLTNAVAAAAGWTHSLALKADGTVVAWGDNSFGQTNVPPGLSNVVAIAASGRQNLALKHNGTVAAWGRVYDKSAFVPAGLTNVIAIAAASTSALALKNDSSLVRWGNESASGSVITFPGLSNIVAIASVNYALTRDGTVIDLYYYDYPVRIPAGLTNVVAIAGSSSLGMALKADGTVVAWGDNRNGQTNVPPDLDHVVAIAAGEAHSLALRADGTVVAWGNNYDDQATVPPGLNHAVALAAGVQHSLALVNDGTPYLVTPPLTRMVVSGDTVRFDARAVGVQPIRCQWQFNGVDLPGQTNTILAISPVQTGHAGIYSLKLSNPVGVAVIEQAVLTVTEGPPVLLAPPQSLSLWRGATAEFSVVTTGSLPQSYQWQYQETNLPHATNSSLRLTDIAFENRGLYRVIVSNSFGQITSPEAQLAVGEVAAWDSKGQPLPDLPPNLTNIMAVAAGASGYYLALRDNGTLIGWGDNQYGQIDFPPNLTHVAAVSAGFTHCLALKNEESLVTWGHIYSDADAWMPTNLNDVVAVSAGWNYSLVLKRDGTVVQWGLNTVPAGLTNVVAVCGAIHQSMALRQNGTVVAWPVSGQFRVPENLTNAVAISANGELNLALKSDGTVIGWQQYYSNSAITNVPPDLRDVVAIAAGRVFHLALKRSGQVVAWNNKGYVTNLPAGLDRIVAVATTGDSSLALTRGDAPPDGEQFTQAAWADNGFTATIPTVLGKVYFPEYSDSLTDPVWIMLPPIPGAGLTKRLTDSTPQVRQRFYRLRQGQ